MAAQPQPRLTPEQYLEIERASPERYEFHRGEMFAMAGGSMNHGTIAANLGAELRQALKGTPCRVAIGDLRVKVSEESYVYPDLVVACELARFTGATPDTLVNPTLLVEVLSPTTEAHDRGFKASRYRRLSSLREYVLVSQSEPQVEVYRRQSDGNWLLLEWSGLDSACELEAAGRRIALAEIYDKVEFSTA